MFVVFGLGKHFVILGNVGGGMYRSTKCNIYGPRATGLDLM